MQRVAIIGAGVSGLALATRLRMVGIPFKIYESREKGSTGHDYGIHIKRQAYTSYLDDSEANVSKRWEEFKDATAVDRIVGGIGVGSTIDGMEKGRFYGIDREIRRIMLENMQFVATTAQRKPNDAASEVSAAVPDVNWNFRLQALELSKGNAVRLSFHQQDESADFDLIIDAGGLNSPAQGMKSHTSNPTLLPYATYQGSRRISIEEYNETYGEHFEKAVSGNVLSITDPEQHRFFQIKKAHHQKSSEHVVELRWVFSRPALHNDDPIYRPERKKHEANVIPHELFPEIVQGVSMLPDSAQKQLLERVFDLPSLKGDRVINWHLRVRLPPLQFMLDSMFQHGYRVIAIGDAAHGLPVLSSTGANVALVDAASLACLLKQHHGTLSKDDCANWVKRAYNRWFPETLDAVQRLRILHGQDELSQKELQDILGFWHERGDSPEKDEIGRKSVDSGADDHTGADSYKDRASHKM